MDENNGQRALETDFLTGGGEMGELIRLHDWSATPLGPMSGWPQSLRSVVSLCVKSRFPTIIQWGWPDLTVLYNEAYVPIIGDAHPRALGRPLFESWPELRPTIEKMLESVLKTGDAVLSEDLLHLYQRGGYPEESYFNVSFNPIVLESGKIGGSFTLMENTTDRVIGDRRLRTLRDLAARCGNATEIDDVCRITGDVLAENRYDLPFVLLYLVDDDRKRARLKAGTGSSPGQTASPCIVDLTETDMQAVWPIARVAHTNSPLQVEARENKFGSLPREPWNESPRYALILPITPSGQQVPAAVLVVGISPRRALDDTYHRFLNSVADQIAATMMRVRATEALVVRQIIDLIPQMIAVMTPDGKQLYTNKFVLDYMGFTLEKTLQPGTRSQGIHPEDARTVDAIIRKGFLGDTPFQVEERIRRKDGQYRWFLAQFNPLLDEQGRVVRWYSTGTDIDDRVRAEERTRNENLALREQIERDSMFEDIVGSSGALQNVLNQLRKVAQSDSTVLVLGETGTGKELIARAIHKRSRRAPRPFITVNCAAIPPSLMASELFGHEKGAFTGAIQRHMGRFEAANGGTIFLDEVGDLPPEMQVALLRVLQEREIERVGSNVAIPVDIRIVAATHRDLDSLVSESKFRQDLLYRLNVVPIHMPPLRDRAADISLLIEYFIDRYAKKAGKKFKAIHRKSLKALQEYKWPGNVRELQNVIERAVILCEEDTFSVDGTWLPPEPAPRLTSESVPVTPGAALTDTLLQREKEMIEAALAESHGRVSGPDGAAAKLDTPSRTLDSKIKRLGINKYRYKR